MSAQTSVTCFANGIHRVLTCSKCCDKLDQARCGYLMKADLNRVEAALRLRAESCEENDDKRAAGLWRGTHRKILELIMMTEEKVK